MKNKKIHYAWFILLAVILIRGFAGGGINTTSGLFLAPVSEDIGVGVGTLSIYLSITSIVLVLFLPLAGKLIHRYDIRLLAVAGAFLQALSFAAFGLLNSVYGWYLLAIPQAVGAALIVNLLGPIMINRWFAKDTGLILGIQMACVGVFGAVLQPVTASVIAQNGWRSAYFLIGGLSFVVVSVTGVFLLRNTPKDSGLSAYGSEERPDEWAGMPAADKKTSSTESGNAVQISEKTALKSISFYLLLLFMISLTGVGVFTQHIPTYGRLIGFSAQQTGWALSFASIGNAVGSIAIGFISDRIGGLKTCFGIIVLGITAVVIFLISPGGFWLFGAAALLHGLVSSSIMVLSPLLTIVFFGQRDYEKIYAKVAMGAPIASILLIPAYGFIYDWMNNYVPVLIGMIVLLLLAAVCIAAGWKNRCDESGCPTWGHRS